MRRQHGNGQRVAAAVMLGLGAVTLGLGAAGCGRQFDPPSEVKSLRILGVQKSEAYARPDTTVELRMLWADGAEDAPRPVHRAWIGGCDNPPGDLYYGCFSQGLESPTGRSLLGTIAGALVATGSTGALPRELPAGFPAELPFGVGDRFSLPIPPREAMLTRQPEGRPEYGLSYVFFAACAGTLEVLTERAEIEALGFPLVCVSETGERLGAEDFVVGYTAIYVFDELSNENPLVDGMEVGGVAYRPTDDGTTCVGAACLGVEPAGAEGDACTVPADCASRSCVAGLCTAAAELDCDSVPCVEPCADDGELECDGIPLRPLLDPAAPANAELDEAAVAAGQTFSEQMWVNYHVDRGGVAQVVRLVRDSTTGWNDELGTELLPPKDPGPLQVWAVVRDNRGGASWVRQTVLVR